MAPQNYENGIRKNQEKYLLKKKQLCQSFSRTCKVPGESQPILLRATAITDG
jgi:hypothetical protein